MKCLRCQQDNPARSKFCLECGAPLKATGTEGPPAPSYDDVTSTLKEALEQQAAMSAILRAISRTPAEIDAVLSAVVESAATFCGADDVVIRRLEQDGLRVIAHHGPIPVIASGNLLPVVPGTVAGRSVLERRTVHVFDVLNEADEFPESAAFARGLGFRTLLSVPLLREEAPLGVIQLRRAEVKPFTDRQVALLQTFADQAVIAIENVRLFKELQERNQALTQAHAQVTEALDRQTATSEILQVISQSRTEVQLVFDAIVDNATRLFRAWSTAVMQSDGQFFHLGAVRGGLPGNEQSVRDLFPSPIHERPILARCLADRAVVHIPDVDSDPAATYMTGDYRRRGIRY